MIAHNIVCDVCLENIDGQRYYISENCLMPNSFPFHNSDSSGDMDEMYRHRSYSRMHICPSCADKIISPIFADPTVKGSPNLKSFLGDWYENIHHQEPQQISMDDVLRD